MIRYLPGVVLVQLVTLALLWVNRDSTVIELLTSVVLPALLLSIVVALWFSAISRMAAQKIHASLIEKHFQEREKLTRELERTRADVMEKASADQARILERASQQREQLVRETHQDMIKAERRASRSANLKVGAAFGVVTMIGVGFLFVQFMTLGLLTITAASGALGGYLLRWKQTRHVMQLASDATTDKLPTVINSEKAEPGSPPFVIDASRSRDDTANSG
ncbi:MAG: hypothetical protein AB8B64_16875 [Granulosicoccus sp.]